MPAVRSGGSGVPGRCRKGMFLNKHRRHAERAKYAGEEQALFENLAETLEMCIRDRRNTTVPTKKSQIFSTAADNQPSVEVNVLQGAVSYTHLDVYKRQG